MYYSRNRSGNYVCRLQKLILGQAPRLVDTRQPGFAAKIYKSYLACAARIIRSQGGVITAYDGDRIMAVYIGDRKNDAAVRTALKINFAVTKIINPAIAGIYDPSYSVRQSVGIDTCEFFVARTGIRGSNDLVWVGRAANYAARLSARSGPASQITAAVYSQLSESCKIGGNGKNMWIPTTASQIGNKPVYTSDWIWGV